MIGNKTRRIRSQRILPPPNSPSLYLRPSSTHIDPPPLSSPRPPTTFYAPTHTDINFSLILLSLPPLSLSPPLKHLPSSPCLPFVSTDTPVPPTQVDTTGPTVQAKNYIHTQSFLLLPLPHPLPTIPRADVRRRLYEARLTIHKPYIPHTKTKKINASDGDSKERGNFCYCGPNVCAAACQRIHRVYNVVNSRREATQGSQPATAKRAP